MAGRADLVAHLVEVEGVSRPEAEAFLDVVEMAEADDPRLHTELLAGLTERMERANQGARAAKGHGMLTAVAGARDTRVGPGDVRALVEAARRGR